MESKTKTMTTTVSYRQIADDYFALSYPTKNVRNRELMSHVDNLETKEKESYKQNENQQNNKTLDMAVKSWLLASTKDHYLRLPSQTEIAQVKKLTELSLETYR